MNHQSSNLSSTQIIWLGFLLVIILMLPVVVVAYTQINEFSTRMETIVKNFNVKSSLTSDMYTAARERSISLLRMLNIRDPIDLSEERDVMSQIASNYMSARASLLKMDLTSSEKDAMDEQLKMIKVAAPAQAQVAQLLIDQKYDDAKAILFAVAIPKHDEILAQLKKILDIQKRSAEDELSTMDKVRERTLQLIMYLSIAALILSGLIIVYMTRQIAESVKLKHLTNLQLMESIKETESAKEESELANKQKSQFLSNMSHELRTPMHAILSYTKLSKKRVNDEMVSDFLERILCSGERLTKLLNNLLDLAKFEAGKMVPTFSEQDITPVISDSISEIESLCFDKKITIDVNIENQVKAVFDKTLILQLMTNFLSNAIKFSSVGSVIDIRVDANVKKLNGKEQSVLEVIVKDAGIGIPQDELETVFEKFVQSSKTESGAGGTGLGLPLCKEIINMHEGLLWAQSPPVNETIGSAFHFIIPVMRNTD